MVKFPIKVSYTKNEQICVIYIIFLFIFKTLIVMSLHEAFLVWTDHCKSWMSNVSLGFASANIAHPRLAMVRPYSESFMQCTITIRSLKNSLNKGRDCNFPYKC